MAKAASPVRLERGLMEAATLTGARFHRSAAEQVEYWASIGRNVSNVIDPDSLLSVTTGLMRLKVEPVVSPVIDPDDLFLAMEGERQHGTLASSITGSAVKYQASMDYPGQLERIASDGLVIIGQFKEGEFIPLDMVNR
jgi:hypothetical protein